MTELDRAGWHGCCERLTILLQNGWNPNNQDGNGNTPLHYLIISKLELFKRLVEDSGNDNLENTSDQLPLHTKVSNSNTVWNGRVDSVKELLEKGANVNVQNYKGEAPLHVLAHSTTMLSVPYKTQAELCHLLLANGADVRLRDFKGYTPLHLAIELRLNITAIILKSASGKIAVNIPDMYGNYPLHTAVIMRNLDGAKLLLENGAKVDGKNKIMQTPFHLLFWNDLETCWQIRQELMEVLLQRGADVNVQDVSGQTPLHYVHQQWFEYIRKNTQRIGEAMKGSSEMNLAVALLLDWDVSLESDKNEFQSPMIFHQELRYSIRKTCLKLPQIKSQVSKRCIDKDYEEDCREEVERMKMERHGNCSLYDIFYKQFGPYFPSNQCLASRVQSKNLKDRYPIYASLLKSTYHRSQERAQLFSFVSAILRTPLPIEIIRIILSFVDDKSLRNVIKAKKGL